MSAWVKEESKWRKEWEHENHRNAKRARQTEHSEISEMMDLWVSQAMNDEILLTGEVLRQKWNHFADLACIPQDERLHLSNGWLGRFKDRYGLKMRKRHGEAASAKAETVERERQRVQKLIKEGKYELRDIFNADETGLFWGHVVILCFLALYLTLVLDLYQTEACRTISNQGLKAKRSD